MSLINMAKREINCKIVYYGIGLSGKTTNLHYIHKTVNPHDVGDMVSIDTETERTLYFDAPSPGIRSSSRFPDSLSALHGSQGQVLYKQTRISSSKGADCVVFVADSQASKLQENVENWND